jgi:hypothetical protein
MKGKWAAGIPPRNFVWIVKDRLAISERPGGYARNHRKIRRQEEILWLRNNGFTRIISLLPSSHNLHAYDELDVRYEHLPLAPNDDLVEVLGDLFPMVRDWLATGERLLLHQEELGDVVMGLIAGYLLWGGFLPSGPQSITVLEELCHRPMGPPGRELVAVAARLRSATSA